MRKESLTQVRLKELLSYDENTGLFTRLISNSPAVKIGDIAGGVTSLGYIAIRVLGKRYQAHRLVFLYMLGIMPNDEVDHIDHNRENNKFENLRLVTRGENMRNRTINKNNKSKVIGVHWCKRDSKWISSITVKGIQITLTRSNDFFEEVCSRKAAEIRYDYHGNHGRL